MKHPDTERDLLDRPCPECGGVKAILLESGRALCLRCWSAAVRACRERLGSIGPEIVEALREQHGMNWPRKQCYCGDPKCILGHKFPTGPDAYSLQPVRKPSRFAASPEQPAALPKGKAFQPRFMDPNGPRKPISAERREQLREAGRKGKAAQVAARMSRKEFDQ